MNSLQHTSVSVAGDSPETRVSLAFHHQQGRPHTCLFQHGLGADYRQCLDVFPDTTRFDFACLDCRAHGSSDYGDTAQLSLTAFADDLIHVIEQKLKPPVAIGGISMGAALSFRIAATRPDLVRALILARPAWLLGAAPQNMQPNLLVGELLSRYPVDKARQIFHSTSTCKELQINSPDNLASLLSFFDRPDARDFAQVLRAVSDDGPGVDQQLTANWRIPTLVMATPDDQVHPVGLAAELAELLNAGPVIHLPAKHHNKAIYLHHFRQHLTEFLDTHSS